MKEVSRQRRWQLRKLEAGLCTICGGSRRGKGATADHCAVHAQARRERANAARHALLKKKGRKK
jgi:hypothetical protein